MDYCPPAWARTEHEAKERVRCRRRRRLRNRVSAGEGASRHGREGGRYCWLSHQDIVILKRVQSGRDNLYVTTDDGCTYSRLVTTQLEKLINSGKNYDLVLPIARSP